MFCTTGLVQLSINLVGGDVMYGIHVKYFYHSGTYTYGRDTGALLRGHVFAEVLDKKHRLKFKTKDQAEQFLTQELHEFFRYNCEKVQSGKGYTPKGDYYLRHGEYHRPIYKIVKLRGVK